MNIVPLFVVLMISILDRKMITRRHVPEKGLVLVVPKVVKEPAQLIIPATLVVVRYVYNLRKCGYSG